MITEQEQTETFDVLGLVDDIGHLIAGMSTTQKGRTLREIKPNVYAPKTLFGKFIENTVNTAIKNAKRKQYTELMDELFNKPNLIPFAQQEIRREFLEKFGEISLIPSEWLDRVWKGNVISKLALLAKENGVSSNEVDNLVYQTLSRVLREAIMPPILKRGRGKNEQEKRKV